MTIDTRHRYRLLRSIGSYAASQGLAQIVAFSTGIIIVRSMPKNDYAFYSIAVAMIAATALVAESGLNSALMSRGAAVRNDRQRLSTLFVTGMKFRFVLGIPIVILGTGAVAFLLLNNGLGIPSTILCSALVLGTLMATVTTGTIQTYHRLNLNFDLIRKTNLGLAVLRFLLVGAFVLLSLISPSTALAISLLCAFATNVIFKHVAKSHLDFGATSSVEDRQAFGISATRTIPMTLMLVVSEQAILVFLSFWGTPEIIADVSALARFSIVFTVVNSVVMDVAAPFFARTEGGAGRVLRRLTGIMGGYAFLAIVLVVGVVATAPLLLRLLGPSYAGLEIPLFVIACGSAVLNIGYAFSSLNQARGWTKHSWVYIPLIVIWAAVGLTFLQLNTTLGATVFVATQALPGLVTQIVRFTAGWSALRRETA